MLTASLDDFPIFGADLVAKMARGDGAESALCVLLTDWRAGGAGGTWTTWVRRAILESEPLNLKTEETVDQRKLLIRENYYG